MGILSLLQCGGGIFVRDSLGEKYSNDTELLCQSPHDKLPQTKRLREETFLPPHPAGWRLEAETQGRAGLAPPEASQAWGRPSPRCVLTRASLWVCLCPQLLFL